MGWERKRGKSHELNRLLRGERDTSFILRADGLHLNADGYALWVSVLKPDILRLAAE